MFDGHTMTEQGTKLSAYDTDAAEHSCVVCQVTCLQRFIKSRQSSSSLVSVR